MSAPSVTIRVGQFNWLSTEEEANVLFQSGTGVTTSYSLPVSEAPRLRALPWPEAVEAAHDYWTRNIWIDTSRKQKDSVAAWLAVDENRDALRAEWRAAEIHKNPLARELARQVAQLQTELADAAAVLAKTVDNFETVLGLAEGESLTVWRAEFGPIALGMYIAREEAQAHCASHYRDFSGDGRLSWYEEEPVEDSTLRMYADGINEGTELETVYLVVPVPLMAAFDPDGDE